MTKFKLNNGYLNIENEEVSDIVGRMIDEEFFWEFLSDALETFIINYNNDNSEDKNTSNVEIQSLLNSTEQNSNKLEDVMKMLSELKTTVNNLNTVSINNSNSGKGVVVGASSSKPKTKSKSRPKPTATNKLNSPSGSKNNSGGDMASLFEAFTALRPDE